MSLLDKINNSEARLIIALDGPSGSGKGLIGKKLADEFGLEYMQSSILYRGLAYICMQQQILVTDDAKIIFLSSQNIIDKIENIDLNTEEIGEFTSKIAVIPEVRQNLKKYLVSVIKDTKRIIMEGRDIATVIAPDADVKIFLTAALEIRAERRFKQLKEKGNNCILQDILELLKSRDERDTLRSDSPLRPSDNALIIDTSYLNPEEVIQKIKVFINQI